MKLSQLAKLTQGLNDKLNNLNITNVPDTLQNYHKTQNESFSALHLLLQSNFDETKQQQTGHEVKIETLRTDMNTIHDQHTQTLSSLRTQQQQIFDDQVRLMGTVQDNHSVMMNEIQQKFDLTELTDLMRQNLTELQSLREHNQLLQAHLHQRQQVADALVYHMLKFQYQVDDGGIHSALAVAAMASGVGGHGALPYGNTPLLSTVSGTPPPLGVSTTMNLTNTSTAISSTGPTFPSPGCNSQPNAMMSQSHTATVTPHLASSSTSTGPTFPPPDRNSQSNAMAQLQTPHLASSSTGPMLRSPSCNSQSTAMAASFHAPTFCHSQSPLLTAQHSQSLSQGQGQASQPFTWTPQQAQSVATPSNLRQQPYNNDSPNSNPNMSDING